MLVVSIDKAISLLMIALLSIEFPKRSCGWKCSYLILGSIRLDILEFEKFLDWVCAIKKFFTTETERKCESL